MLTPVFGLLKLSIPEFSRDNVKVFLVNGEYIRTNSGKGKDLFDDGISFTEGGNPFRYNWVPKTDTTIEIWLDLCEASMEIPFTLIHESHESYLMLKGMDYDSAHDATNLVEIEARQHCDKVPDMLKQELDRLNKTLSGGANG